MKPYQVILNPAAGAGNGLRILPELKRQLDTTGISYDLIQSPAPGQPRQLAYQAAEAGVAVVVAAGGDGTVNEIVNGLMAAKNAGLPVPVLGLLCVGRGNDFAGSLGLPAGLAVCCQILASGHRRWVDIGRVSGGIVPAGLYFANCVGVGFDAVTTLEVRKLPRWGGFLSFLIAILKTIFIYKDAPLAVIEYDGQTLTQRSLLVSVMNGRRLGGGFYMAPTSEFDDGLLDLCIAEQMSAWRILRLIPHFTKGTQATQPGIRTARSARVTITSQDKPIPAQTDGEIISTEGMRLEVEIFPRQLEVIVGAGKSSAH